MEDVKELHRDRCNLACSMIAEQPIDFLAGPREMVPTNPIGRL
jgi:hypothetical protein